MYLKTQNQAEVNETSFQHETQTDEPTTETEQQSLSAHPDILRTRIDPRSLTPARVLQLQHTIGNQAVQRVIQEYRKAKTDAVYIARIGEGVGSSAVATLEPPTAVAAADELDEVEDQAALEDVQAEPELDLSGKSAPHPPPAPPPPPPVAPPRPSAEAVQAAMAQRPPVVAPGPSAEARVAPVLPPRPSPEKLRAFKQSPKALPGHAPAYNKDTQNYNADVAQDYSEYAVSGGGAVSGGVGFSSKMAALGGASAAGTLASGFGAAGGLLGVVGAGTETVRGFQQWDDENLKGGERAMGTLRYTGNLHGNATQSSATGAVGISHLLGNAGAVAGATAAAGAGAIYYGTSEMIRGGYGTYKGHQRQKALSAIADSSSNSTEIQDSAHLAATTQEMRKKVGAATFVKGALLVGGGIALIAAATNPVGWALLGGAAIIGGIAALVRFLAKRRRKKAVAIRVLGIQPEYNQYKADKEKAESISRFKPTQRNASLAAVSKRNPLHREMIKAGYEPKDYAKFYADYVNKTANALYQYGVLGKAESSWGAQSGEAIGQMRTILSRMGLKVSPNSKPPTPSPEAIGSALHK